MVLIFGCRNEEKDYYYKDEWPKYANLKVITAFSRNSEDAPKEYVQHKIKEEENAIYISDLIVKQNANIYVSGRAKFMPKSVENASKETLKHHMKEDESEQYIKQMKKSRRYQQEVW